VVIGGVVSYTTESAKVRRIDPARDAEVYGLRCTIALLITVICKRLRLYAYCWSLVLGGSVAELLACWTQAQKAQVQIAVATLSGNSLRQTAHTHRASVHQAAKLVATLLWLRG